MFPRVLCFRHLLCAGLVLTKAISIFLQSTNIRRLKFLTTADLHFYTHCLHGEKFINQTSIIDNQVIRMQIH